MIRTHPLILPLLAALCVLMVLFSLGVGTYPVSLATQMRITAALLLPAPLAPDPTWTEAEWTAVVILRLPRVLLVTLAGAGLGLAGASLQGMLRNPLVGPDIVGISAGSAFGGMLAILLDFSSTGLLLSAFAGGAGALFLAWSLARLGRGGGVLPVILAGIIVAAFFTALNGLLQYVADPDSKLPAMVYWLIGSFAGSSLEDLRLAAPPLLIAGTGLVLLRWRLNLLSLGDLDAAALGVRVGGLRWLIVALVATLVASQVAVSGIVGWVGLVVPHCARMLVGADHRRLLPASALVGGVFLLAMDNLARTLTVQELPIGVLTAVVGTPVFAFLFWRSQARGWVLD
ncbi:FecCD family ABC transporter permease [Pararhodospirillum oryzae]|uniref:ABC transporter permease n=1 Tax=Pararhodospirillum oryzae TaxID=478448 RepID=A0A512HBQ0_9PROT|nr:iron ABC transporter permease [Pararhodospirillum oryzae]GEO82865.1 ABC transporter permease [Pararhodospirillum oryzae]